ncbi:nitroreductase family protein [Natronoglomus mannanivorans]|uniref:Nitroreductase family protein n=1 Tax=Natronoglomus mannanivorans TaxID=2979990 RepID=A0AAP2YWN4_9EURY|nr:nitroreductase family protein [Halobacteria archaeon AArc-xg1-1]
MDTSVTDAIETRIELRDYADDAVDDETKRAILEAGRLAPSGKNTQHWRFVLIDRTDDLEALADCSPTGGWVADADFAIAICTDPDYGYNEIDAGRAATHMQLVAWERDVGSCMFTVDQARAREFLELPDEYDLTALLGFGYPDREIRGRKDRKPLAEIAFRGRFGEEIDLE